MKDTHPRPFFDGPLRPELDEGLHPPNIQTIEVAKDISLKYDSDADWFAIEDADWFSYDRGGAVIMNFSDIDALIVALGQLRDKVK